MATDGGGVEPTFTVDTLGNHLISNTPGGDGANRWRSPLEMARGFQARFAWRGPYVSDAVLPDPWGNRHMVNVFALYAPPARDRWTGTAPASSVSAPGPTPRSTRSSTSPSAGGPETTT